MNWLLPPPANPLVKKSKLSSAKTHENTCSAPIDPFHQGRPLYDFQNWCLRYDESIPLEDGTTKLFLNTASKSLDSLDGDLRLFYDYVRERTARTPFTRELDSSISRMKQEKEERNMYLTYSSRMMESRQDGYEEGREQGISIGLERGAYQTKLETARNFLSMGLSLEQAAQGTGLPLETVEQLAQDL